MALKIHQDAVGGFATLNSGGIKKQRITRIIKYYIRNIFSDLAGGPLNQWSDLHFL